MGRQHSSYISIMLNLACKKSSELRSSPLCCASVIRIWIGCRSKSSGANPLINHSLRSRGRELALVDVPTLVKDLSRHCRLTHKHTHTYTKQITMATNKLDTHGRRKHILQPQIKSCWGWSAFAPSDRQTVLGTSQKGLVEVMQSEEWWIAFPGRPVTHNCHVCHISVLFHIQYQAGPKLPNYCSSLQIYNKYIIKQIVSKIYFMNNKQKSRRNEHTNKYERNVSVYCCHFAVWTLSTVPSHFINSPLKGPHFLFCDLKKKKQWI